MSIAGKDPRRIQRASQTEIELAGVILLGFFMGWDRGLSLSHHPFTTNKEFNHE
jgi:hypothetical protein